LKTIKGYSTDWDSEWKEFHGLSLLGKWFSWSRQRALKQILCPILEKNEKILDLGCGYCETTQNIKNIGFKNVIGIDNSPTGLGWCEKIGFKIGMDVFLMDGRKTQFKDNTFSCVFESGLLEHFKNFKPFVKEMYRISKKYALICETNHFSLWKKLVVLKGGIPVGEYAYKPEDYIKVFEDVGFEFIKKKNCHLNEFYMILFKKPNKRKKSEGKN